MVEIHATALVDARAQLGEGVKIGPYCVVGGDVVLGDNVTLQSHVVVTGHTSLGKGCSVYPFASLGSAPQDLKFKGEVSRLEIGDETVIRESVTMNPGTEGGGLLTKVGSNCLFMVGSHVAHDCMVGDHVILANNATLAGHVFVGDFTVLGGLSAVHQFVRIGEGVMVGGMTGIARDVPPYAAILPDAHGTINGINIVGLRRRNIEKETIAKIRAAYDILFFDKTMQYGETLKKRLDHVIERFSGDFIVQKLIDFIISNGERGIISALKKGS